MTDFFLNLASRAVDNENAIRPRVSGRFEPSEPVAEFAEVNEEIGSGAGATVIVPDSPQRPRESKAAAEPSAQATPGRSSPPTESAPINPDAADAPQSNAPVQARPEVNPAGGEESQTDISPAMSRHLHDADEEELLQQDDETTVVKHDTHVQERTVVARPIAQTPTARPAAAGRANAAIATAAASRRPAIGKPARETLAARNPRDMPRPADAASPPETVVHVTIGRVELRAPPAAAPPRKREQASQTGTLAEYLQKHAAARERS